MLRSTKLLAVSMLAFVVAILALTSCSVTIGYSGTNVGNQIKATYQQLNGSKTKNIDAGSGETIEISYSSVVEEGELSIVIEDSNGDTVKEFETGTSGTATLTIGKNAPYKIVITGHDTKGSFDISWEQTA